MINYAVYRGVYPFDEQLATIIAPAEHPEEALDIALTMYTHHEIDDPHPVVAPINLQ